MRRIITMKHEYPQPFARNYESLLKRLKLRGMQPLYGLKFYYAHVLDQPWPGAELTKAPKVSRLPDIVTVAQMQQIINATRVLSYRVFFFTLYSMGLRLGEGLQLRVGDLDAQQMRVHVRDAKGNRDRLVPLPTHTLEVLRAFWKNTATRCCCFPAAKKASQTQPAPRRTWIVVGCNKRCAKSRRRSV
ncbi:tyrosine-type recombinase/integrase [Candidatus Nitrotoga sp. AM1P]|uniref:tyrosine-type recombinase/integrase n=1 Tax=Candidatus Nitrotoga sp. AM1P TaxID=2559597 RepID=UPI00211070CA|nr:site-specific integrase [Candidatus Nitrotoga sp. AM1P]